MTTPARLAGPRLRPEVPRTLLLRRLQDEGRPVLLVVAPAGYGKSTLVHQWLNALHRPAALVELTTQHDDPVLLWSRLAPALADLAAKSAGGPSAVPGTVGEGTRAASSVADSLAQLNRTAAGAVLVLEDLHHLRRQETVEGLQQLVLAAGPGLRLAITSRRDPPLRLSRLRAAARISDVRLLDLAFTGQETAAYLAGELAVPLDDASVAAVHRATEGWPVAVCLAGAALVQSNDPEQLTLRAAATDRHVSEYLMEEVLDAMPEQVRSLAVDVSLLPSWSALDAQRLTGRGDCDLQLERLAELSLLHPAPQRRVRFHDLVRHELRLQLLRADPHRAVTLSAVATEILLERGEVGAAVRCALDAGLTARATGIARERWGECLLQGRLVELQRLLAQLPPGTVASSSHLEIAVAWLAVAGNRWEEVQAAVARALALPDEGAFPDGPASVASAVELLRATNTWPDLAEQHEHARAAYAWEGGRPSYFQAQAHQVMAVTHLLLGEPDLAEPYARTAHSIAVRRGLPVVAANARLVLSVAATTAGDPVHGETYAREAVGLATTAGFAGASFVGAYHLALAEALMALKRYPAASQALQEAIGPAEGHSPALGAWAYAVHARLRCLLGDVRAAHADLETARAFLARCQTPGLADQKVAEAEDAVAHATRASSAEPLSEREIEVIRLLSQGLSKSEVAGRLFVAYSTVHSHTKAIYRKLGTSSKQAAVARAAELGLLDGPPAQEPGGRSTS